MVGKIVPFSDELAGMIDERMEELTDELGSEPGPDDRLFPDHLEHLEHEISQAMKSADIDPAILYAFEETGLMVSEENRDMFSDQQLAEWETAIARYREEHDQPDDIQYPLGIISMYGPDDQVTTKVVASVMTTPESEPIMERFVSSNIAENPSITEKMMKFFESHGVVGVVSSGGNMGCPHEEGPDFPVGEDCPFCPFWKGKQGSAAIDEFDSIGDENESEFLSQLLESIPPELVDQFQEIADATTSEDEFVNAIMVGPCPECDSDSTRDCENDPEIEDPTIGKCDNCGQLWCCDCDETFRTVQAANDHECPFWDAFEKRYPF